ncbi:Fic family protein [Xanthomonas campestris]|uniref:Fic family protein n=1 Tax=Xanthomonas campestris TaxID=339 RepID=UPI002B2352AF|nr:Fic family protein [Xanthomonas campestris]MEA9705987.1 Fic family protein [Xanthomonas campestris pv. raphani]MEA9729219.1 Fic family protein [Xanthomonas campestris pv. raphani]
MNENFELAPLDLAFAPLPGRRDSPDASVWLDASFSVYTPALLEPPLRTHEKIGDYQRFESDARCVGYLSTLSSRLIHVCRGGWSFSRIPDLRASHHAASAINASLKAGLPDTHGVLSWSLNLAKNLGNRQVESRTDNSWVGGKKPSEAWFVLPQVEQLPYLLRNLEDLLQGKSTQPINCAFFEAIAYQLICIHPLSDTNGRVTRTLLINLAARYRNLYPLYVAHCLTFAKRRAGQTWMKASLSAANAGSAESDVWLNQIGLILQKVYDFAEAGLDPRALWSLLASGYVCEETLCAGKNACSPALAAKIMRRLPALLEKEQGMFYSAELEILIIGIDRSINKDSYESE